jgi:cell division protein FtsB
MTITAPPPRTRVRAQPRVPQRSTQHSTQRSTPPEIASPPRTAPPADRTRIRSAASQRAYARKAQRQAAYTGARPALAARLPFVLLVMALLAVGLIASLWLSTAAAADSYRLEQARLQARELSERSERLRQEVATLQTAPELARRARDLGMVPTDEPARLVIRSDGTVLVIGTPAPATAPPPAPQPPADAQAPTDAQPPLQEGPPPAGQQAVAGR